MTEKQHFHSDNKEAGGNEELGSGSKQAIRGNWRVRTSAEANSCYKVQLD